MRQNLFSPCENHLQLLDRDLTRFEISACETQCEKYIKSDTFEIEINNLNEVNEYFRIFKDIIQKQQSELEIFKDYYA
jgi:hypothetical protein